MMRGGFVVMRHAGGNRSHSVDFPEEAPECLSWQAALPLSFLARLPRQVSRRERGSRRRWIVRQASVSLQAEGK